MVRTILIAWVILEFAAYALFLRHFSVWAGLTLGLGSTLVGFLALKIAGRRFVLVMTEQLRSGELRSLWNSESFLILGAFLLLLPGFLSDLAGLALLAAAGLRPRKRPLAQTTRDIDLSREDWKRLPDETPK